MWRVLAVVSLTVAGFGVGVAVATPVSAGGGGGCHEMTEGTGDTVEMIGFCFSPSVLHVGVGAEVTWTNEDPVEHVVTGTGWGLGATLGQGDAGSHRFEDPGTYPYTCYLHPGMNGVVLVGGEGAAGAAVPDAPVTTPRSVSRIAAEDVDTGGASPLGAGVVGAFAGLTAGAVGARVWRRRAAA